MYREFVSGNAKRKHVVSDLFAINSETVTCFIVVVHCGHHDVEEERWIKESNLKSHICESYLKGFQWTYWDQNWRKIDQTYNFFLANLVCLKKKVQAQAKHKQNRNYSEIKTTPSPQFCMSKSHAVNISEVSKYHAPSSHCSCDQGGK